MNKIFYAVMRLNEDITFTDPQTLKERTEKLNGIAGFIPCYETIEEAQEASCDGKYEIVLIKPK